MLDIMTKTGIIGPGLIWQRTHREILSTLAQELPVAAYAARSPENRKLAGESYPQATAYSDAAALIADPEVQAVVILTPIHLNAPMALLVLEAGKHAIVEKPVARSLAEARELFEVEKRSQGTLYILEQHPHKSLIPVVKGLFRQGAAGRPVAFERAVHVQIDVANDSTGGFGSTPWRQVPDYPLGNFFDGGIHEVALLQMLFGPPEAVFAAGQSLRETFGDVDQLSMVIRYPGAVHGVFSHSSSLGLQGNHFVIHGTEGVVTVTDREVTLRRNGADQPVKSIPVPWHQESVAMWQEIADALPSGSPGIYHRREALADLAFMDAVQKSLDSEKMEMVSGE